MRKSKRHKKAFLTLIIILILFSIRYISFLGNLQVENTSNSNFEIHVIDVGQAESILVTQGKHAMLIDTGNMFDGAKIAKYLKKQGISNLDFLVLTHFHVDHLGGAHKILSAVHVEKVLCMSPKYISTVQEAFWYSDMRVAQVTSSLFHHKKIEIESPYEEAGILRNFYLGEAKVEILSQETNVDIVNNKSIVMKITYGDVSALFMGDSQKEVERDLIEAKMDISADILKVGHHGSKTSTSMEFLEEVSPQYALISCGKENDYGHPNSFVIEKLSNMNTQILRTDLDGNIIVKTDGTKEGIIVTSDKNES